MIFFLLVLGSTVPGACYKPVPQACVPCREPWPQGSLSPVSGIVGGRASQRPPSLCSSNNVAIWGAWCGKKSTSTRLGMAFFFFFFFNCSLSNSFLRSESFPFCFFFWQYWSYPFFVHATPPLREKADLTSSADFTLHMRFDLLLYSYIRCNLVWWYYFGDCSFLELCNHKEAAFDLLSI